MQVYFEMLFFLFFFTINFWTKDDVIIMIVVSFFLQLIFSSAICHFSNKVTKLDHNLLQGFAQISTSDLACAHIFPVLCEKSGYGKFLTFREMTLLVIANFIKSILCAVRGKLACAFHF